MSTLALIAGLCIVALAVAERLPGVRVLVSPLVNALFALMRMVFGSGTGWLAWAVKTLWRDHLVVLRHLFQPRHRLDPADTMRRDESPH